MESVWNAMPSIPLLAAIPDEFHNEKKTEIFNPGGGKVPGSLSHHHCPPSKTKQKLKYRGVRKSGAIPDQ